ncbi:hypothetical protein TNCT_580301 [Trichonephila clavata]|uniref:Uncharacterized protein n=1 Tax=Trichonephila clavata TaxID=2740835 RepID=A0A8X6F941_TRICU|nr:hypothetical protein TNCT_580301 [Trichonephila clavata]
MDLGLWTLTSEVNQRLPSLKTPDELEPSCFGNSFQRLSPSKRASDFYSPFQGFQARTDSLNSLPLVTTWTRLWTYMNKRTWNWKTHTGTLPGLHPRRTRSPYVSN